MSITKSTLIRAGIVALGLSTLIPSGDAGAQRRRQRGQSAQASGSSRTTTRLSAAIAPSLDGLQWGWSRQRTLRFLREAIETEYEPMIRTAPGGAPPGPSTPDLGWALALTTISA